MALMAVAHADPGTRRLIEDARERTMTTPGRTDTPEAFAALRAWANGEGASLDHT
jgi:hypothetical protein